MIVLSNLINNGQVFWDIMKWISEQLDSFYQLFDFLPPFIIPAVHMFLLVAICFQIIGRS